ncbi:MAG: phage holin family protein [Actinomycetota bacterium]
MSSAAGPGHDQTPRDDRSVGELVFDVSERVSTLIREEIELAKTEIREKVTKLVQGSVVGIAAGVFALMGLAMLMHGLAWLLNDLFFEDNVWIGFMVEAVFWFGVAAAAGYFAFRSVRAGAPPTPDMAIEEARRTKETLGAGTR